MDEPIATLKARTRKGKRLPVIHILMPDGRVTEFSSMAVVVPEGDNPDGGPDVFAVLINRDCVPYVTPDGNLAVVPCPAFALGLIPDQGKLITYKDIVRRSGLSLSTVKRAVEAGELKSPDKVGKRAVRFRTGDVEEWLARLPAKVLSSR